MKPTKTDWAYQQAKSVLIDKVFADKASQIRAIAALLRHAAKLK